MKKTGNVISEKKEKVLNRLNKQIHTFSFFWKWLSLSPLIFPVVFLFYISVQLVSSGVQSLSNVLILAVILSFVTIISVLVSFLINRNFIIPLKEMVIAVLEEKPYRIIKYQARYDEIGQLSKKTIELLSQKAEMAKEIIFHQRAEEELRKLSRAVAQSPVSIIIADSRGKIEYINPKFTEQEGYTLNEVAGKSPSILQSGKTPETTYKELWQTITSGNDWHGELQNINKKGELYWALVTISSIKNYKGEITHYISVSEDITKRKFAEDKLRQSEIEIRKAKEIAEKANQAKSQFLANMSHEIRTPMNAIMGFSEILKKRISDPGSTGYLDGIISSGKSLLSLINDILDLSKIEAGKLSINYEPVDLRPLLREMHQIFSVILREKAVEFRLEIDAALPEGLLIDELRLRQILFNMIGNAVKFTDSGSITVHLSCERLKDEKLASLSLEIKDTGIGIPADQHEKIFEVFTQQEGQNQKKYGGTGLGLSITKRLIDIMNGTIEVQSEVNKGST
ncbi:MAG: PAS domain-containing sensor histidine kinase, partial [Syntrophothermus sp.]